MEVPSMQSFLTSVLETHPRESSKSAIVNNFFIFFNYKYADTSRSVSRSTRMHSGTLLQSRYKNYYQENRINRMNSRKTEQTVFLYHIFFETTKCHFLDVQAIFVKRSDGQLAGRDKVILNISHAKRVLDNRIRSILQNFVIIFILKKFVYYWLFFENFVYSWLFFECS